MLLINFSDIYMNCVLFDKNESGFQFKKNKKNTGKMGKKILEKSGNFVSPEKWELWLNSMLTVSTTFKKIVFNELR